MYINQKVETVPSAAAHTNTMTTSTTIRVLRWTILVIVAIFFANAAVPSLMRVEEEAEERTGEESTNIIKEDDNAKKNDVSSLSSSPPPPPSYGIDVSLPIQRPVSTNYPWLPHNTNPTTSTNLDNDVPAEYKGQPLQVLGDRHAVYLRHLNGCREAYSKAECDVFEYDRMLMVRNLSLYIFLVCVLFKSPPPPHLF